MRTLSAFLFAALVAIGCKDSSQPQAQRGVGIDLASNESLSLRSNSSADDSPPPEEDKPDDGEGQYRLSGRAYALDEGKMGKKDSDRAEGRYKMQKNQDPSLARMQAIEQVRNAGVLGSSAIASGFDDTNVYGGRLDNSGNKSAD